MTTCSTLQPVALLGLFNSGSSLLSSMMLDLGFNIGQPHSNFFEPIDLSGKLRQWWSESTPPVLTARVPQDERVGYLREWIANQQPAVSIKHPLLCLSAEDLLVAWGPGTRYIRCGRRLDDSIAALTRRGWFPGREVLMQTRLHQATEEFLQDRDHLVVNYDQVISDPGAELQRIISWLGITPTTEALTRAAARVKPPKHLPTP